MSEPFEPYMDARGRERQKTSFGRHDYVEDAQLKAKNSNTSTLNVQIDIDKTKYALEHDSEFFINFFLGEELTLPVPQFHCNIFKKMTFKEIKKYACAIPRDHAKTTLAKLACVWHFLFSRYRFIVYISNTASIAVNAVLDIVNFLRSPNFEAIYGPVKPIVWQEGNGFYKFTIGTKICILRALGAGQQVRGMNIDNQRPQLAVVDDLEDLENTETEMMFLKLKRWFWGTFRKALDKIDNKIIHLGNMVSHRCMLKEHCESPFWHSDRFGAILSNGDVLWPGAFTIEKLKEEFLEYSRAGMAHIWFAEMMNMPVAGGNGLIRSEEIYYRPSCLPGDPEFAFITVDPAISNETWAHKSAIVVHGWIDNITQTCDYEADIGVDPYSLFLKIVDLAFKWKVSVIGIESAAYQSSLQYVFAHYCLLLGIENLIFVPLIAGQRKTERLAAWASTIKAQQYAIPEGDFIMTEQLLMYNPLKKENDCDIIDAAAYCPQMLENYWHEIINSFGPQRSPAVLRGSYELEVMANG